MNRHVIITGGATGIGRAVAAAFAAEQDDVWITGRRENVVKETATALGLRVTGVRCDQSNPAEVATLLTQVPDRIDVLVNCAGGNTDFDRPAPRSLTDLASNWRANIESNLISAVLTTEAVRPRFVRGSRVVHVGSIAAEKGAGAYGAAKAGLASWNIGLSAELGPLGITCNVVAPGYVADTEFFRDRLTDRRRESLIAAAHTRQPSAPEDIASAVLFLASAQAGQITAQTIAVNGGERPTR